MQYITIAPITMNQFIITINSSQMHYIYLHITHFERKVKRKMYIL